MRELRFCKNVGDLCFECVNLRATKNSAAMKNQAMA